MECVNATARVLHPREDVSFWCSLIPFSTMPCTPPAAVLRRPWAWLNQSRREPQTSVRAQIIPFTRRGRTP